MTVGKTTIKAANLEEHLQWAHDTFESDAISYWRCVNDEGDGIQTLSDSLHHLGKVIFHLRSDDPTLSKKIAMVRKPGMVVYLKPFRSPVPFCGVFRCENDSGNAKLRDMEPPEHNLWTGDLPEKGENKKVEKEFLDYMRAQIRDLTNVDDDETLTIPDLGRFLPDDAEANDPAEGNGDGALIPNNAEIPTSPIGSKAPRGVTDELGDAGPDSGPDENDGDGGDDSGSSGSGSESGDGDGTRRLTDVPIESRAFSQDAKGREYAVVVRPADHSSHDVDLTLRVVGEDHSDPVGIASVTSGGKSLPFTPDGKVTSVKLKGKGTTRLDLVLTAPRRVSLEVLAHED